MDPRTRKLPRREPLATTPRFAELTREQLRHVSGGTDEPIVAADGGDPGGSNIGRPG